MSDPEQVGSANRPPPSTLERETVGDDFGWFIVAVTAAFYGFDWLLLKSSAWPDAIERHYKVYACTLFVVLPLSLAASGLLRLVRDTWLQKNRNLLPVLISVQTAFWIWVSARPSEALLAPELWSTIRWALPVLVLAAVGVARLIGPARRAASSFVQAAVFCALPPIGLVFLWHFKGQDPIEASALAGLAILSLVLSAPVPLFARREQAATHRDRWDMAFVVLLVLVVVPTVLEINYFHQDFYLGPVNEVLGGRSMLVNVNCQYGVGVIYFLSLAFKLLFLKSHYVPFTALLVTLTVAQFVLFYWIIRQIFRSRVLAVQCMVALVIFGRMGFYHVDNIVFPSSGPLRFGLPLLVLAAGFLRRTRPSRQRSWAWAEAGLLGVASIWSMETFVYSLSAYGFSTLAESWALASAWPGFVRRGARGFVRPVAAIAAAVIGLILLTLLRSGKLPVLGLYLTYLTLYSGNLAAWELAVWTPWILVPSMICLSLLASAVRTYRRKDLDAGHFFIAGLGGAAAAEFSYFIMRSHPNNLTHIAPPVVVLLFYWLDQSWKRASPARWTALPVAFLILCGLGSASLPSISSCLDRSLFAWTEREAVGLLHAHVLPIPDFFVQVWAPRPTSPRAAAHLRLAGKYAPDQKTIAAISPDSVEFYSLTGRKDPFAIGCPLQDSLQPGFLAKEATPPLPLKSGDVLLVMGDYRGSLVGPPVAIDPSLQPLVRSIKQQFRLEPLESDSPTGVWAARVTMADSAARSARVPAPRAVDTRDPLLSPPPTVGTVGGWWLR